MKKLFLLLFSLFVFLGCTQSPSKITYKKSNVYKPTYSEVYVESPDGKLARSLRGDSDTKEAEKVNIISNSSIYNTENYNYYKVKSGDNLWTIARNNDMSVQELVELNNLKKPYTIKAGQTLVLTKNTTTEKKYLTSSVKKTTIKKTPLTYKVESGDNLTLIAREYDMSLKELIALNNLKYPYNIKIGQVLKVEKTSTAKSTPTIVKKTSSTYKVKSGDNLTNIAKEYDMTLKELVALNNLKYPYNIRIGQVLKVEKTSTSQPTTTIAKTTTTTTTKPVVKKPTITKSSNANNSFIWPVKGSVISTFGNKSNGLYNDGINISAPKGTDFVASESGVVAYVGNELRGYGTIILIKHNSNWISAYAHCDTANVKRGDKVEKGQVIGKVGSEGNVTKPQLYFSLRNGRDAVDPLKYLK